MDVPAGTAAFELELKRDTMITLTTLLDLSRAGGEEITIPASAGFSLPYADDFEQTASGRPGRFWADLGGVFTVVVVVVVEEDEEGWGESNAVLRQVVTQDPGANAWITNPEPITIIGNREWTDYSVSASAKVVGGGDGHVQVGARLGNVSSFGGKDGWNGGASGYFCNGFANGTVELVAGGGQWRVLG